MWPLQPQGLLHTPVYLCPIPLSSRPLAQDSAAEVKMLFPTIGFTKVHKCTRSCCPRKPSGGIVLRAVDPSCLSALLCPWPGEYKTEPSPPVGDVVIGLSCGAAPSSERTFFILLLATPEASCRPTDFFGMAKKTVIWRNPGSLLVFDIKKLCKRPSQ